MPLIPFSRAHAQCRALWLVFGRPAGGSRGERADWLVPLRLGSVVDHIDRDDALSRWRASSCRWSRCASVSFFTIDL